MTVSETILWDALRHEIQGYKFRRQHAIGDYHEQPIQQLNDQHRTAYLESKGYKVIRFKNEEVDFNINEVIDRIKEKFKK